MLIHLIHVDLVPFKHGEVEAGHMSLENLYEPEASALQ